MLRSDVMCDMMYWVGARAYVANININGAIQISEFKLGMIVSNPSAPHTDFPFFNPGNMSKCRALVLFGRELSEELNDGTVHYRQPYPP